jgi:plastocyanin
VHIALPNTPHTLSIHASNANTATLQGLSRGGGVRRYGFEFTIPVTLSRFFHPDAAAAVATTVAPAPAAETAVASRSDSVQAQVTSRTDAARAPVDSATPAQPVAPARDTTAMAPTINARPASPPRAEAPRRVRRPAPRTVNARINGLAYVPSRIDIAPGTTVQWKNNDPLIHTVTATDGSFGSPQFGLDGTYRHTFTTPGTYTYYCTLHPNMKATVVVK